MEDRGIYNLTQTQIVETDMKAIALSAAAEIGYTLTQEQATELAYQLAESTAAVNSVVAQFCGQLVYDLENEHPVHTWARWSADVENDQTPPGQRYTDYVDERHHLDRIMVGGQHYLADRGTSEGLDAYFSTKTNRLKNHLHAGQFDRFMQDRLQEGRMVLVPSGAAAAG